MSVAILPFPPQSTTRRPFRPPLMLAARAALSQEHFLRFKVFCGKDPYPAEKMLLGAWNQRFGDEAALLECLRSIVYDVDDVVKDLRQEVRI